MSPTKVRRVVRWFATPPVLQPADPAPQEFAKPALMNHTPVRSGQRVYARHRDYHDVVKGRLARARKQIQSCLENEGFRREQ